MSRGKTPLLLALALLAAAPSFACSILMYSEGGRSFFCGNEDWSFTDPAFRSYPAKKGAYAYLLLGWMNYLPSYPQAGINSEGLCFDWAMVPSRGAYASTPGRQSLSIDFTVDALKKCKNVEEFLGYIRDRDIPNLAEEHLFVADRSGASCAIEYAKGRIQVVRNERSYQFVTNFALSDPQAGGYPCARYAKMESFFGKDGAKSGRLAEILDAVHQEGQYPTVYSYIFDLGGMRMTLFRDHEYSRALEYSLPELFKKMDVVAIGGRK